MDLAHFSMSIHELLNKDTDIVTKEVPLIIFDIKSDIWMAKNGKDNKHTSHISRIVRFLRNGEKWKVHRIGYFEGGLQLADIATRNFGENELNPWIKYTMVRFDNWDRTLVQ